MTKTRVRSGCITCKIRRVKCDETRPTCQRCVSTGRACDGYAIVPFSRRELHAASQASALGSILPNMSMNPLLKNAFERRQFDFFRKCTVPTSNSLVACRFWDRVVLQMCHAEPTVKHAVLALTSLHQVSDWPADDEWGRRQQLRFAEEQYGKAVSSAQQLLSTADIQSPQAVLVACVVFICYENIRGNFKTSHVHLSGGLALLDRCYKDIAGSPGKASNDVDEISDVLRRLDFAAMTMSDARTTYKQTLSRSLFADVANAPRNAAGINQMRNSMISLFRALYATERQLGEAVVLEDLVAIDHITNDKTECIERVKAWRSAFQAMDAELSEPMRRQHAKSLSLLHIYSLTLKITLTVGSVGGETRWDACHGSFVRVMEHASQIFGPPSGSPDETPLSTTAGTSFAATSRPTSKSPPRSNIRTSTRSGNAFSFDIGIVPPLFIIGMRCRHPQLRRSAIRMLRDIERQEGPWHSLGAAAVAQAVMRTEEGSLDVQVAADVPEHRRVQAIAIVARMTKREIDLKMMLKPQGPDGPWLVLEETVTF